MISRLASLGIAQDLGARDGRWRGVLVQGLSAAALLAGVLGASWAAVGLNAPIAEMHALAMAAGARPAPVTPVVCSAAAPAPGATFAGPVLHVFDGKTLCIAQGPTPSEWVLVRLSESDAADRPALMEEVFARQMVCVAEHSDVQGVSAHCRLADED